ncbi:MAG: GGDEF domain-containing protein [Desulfovibrionaceae bacterium]|nr:GGDEF domain-containing protein [Desulfovibrionaceae bacterium]
MNEKLLFESLYDVIPYNTYVVDVRTYEIVFVNRAFSDSRGDLTGQVCHRAIYEEDAPCLHCKLGELVSKEGYPNGSTLIFEHFNAFDDRWYQMQEKALVWPDGRTVKCSIAVDVTELKETQNRLAEAHAELAMKTRELERLSVTDKLTGLCNRMRLDEIGREEMVRAVRYGRPMSLVLLDIDKFKTINDTYGHQVGDETLVQFARILAAHCRSADTIGRWGGEEFVVFTPETDLQGARLLAEKLRRQIQDCVFPTAGRLSASFGVAEFTGTEDGDELFRRVDQALYKAKSLGGNCVQTAD